MKIREIYGKSWGLSNAKISNLLGYNYKIRSNNHNYRPLRIQLTAIKMAILQWCTKRCNGYECVFLMF